MFLRVSSESSETCTSVIKFHSDSMPIHLLQYVFHVEKLFCTHRFFHKYEQTRTEKFAHALLLTNARSIPTRSLMLYKYSR